MKFILILSLLFIDILSFSPNSFAKHKKGKGPQITNQTKSPTSKGLKRNEKEKILICQKTILGDLGISDIDEIDSISKLHEKLFYDWNTRKQFKLKYQEALNITVQKLSSNKNFTFFKGDESGSFANLLPNLWRRVVFTETEETTTTFLYTPKESKHRKLSESINSFYSSYIGEQSLECLNAQRAVSYLTRLELFGNALFDEIMMPIDLALGSGEVLYDLEQAQSIYSNLSDNFYSDVDNSFYIEKFEENYFTGLNGYLKPHNYEYYLSHADELPYPYDLGENFIITDMSHEAFLYLKNKDPDFSFTNINNDIAELQKEFVKANSNLEDPQLKEALKKYLENDFYRGTKLYIHPIGVKDLYDVVERQLFLNGKVTPYKIELYPSNVFNFIFPFYVERKLNRCLAQNDYWPVEKKKEENHSSFSDSREAFQLKDIKECYHALIDPIDKTTQGKVWRGKSVFSLSDKKLFMLDYDKRFRSGDFLQLIFLNLENEEVIQVGEIPLDAILNLGKDNNQGIYLNWDDLYFSLSLTENEETTDSTSYLNKKLIDIYNVNIRFIEKNSVTERKYDFNLFVSIDGIETAKKYTWKNIIKDQKNFSYYQHQFLEVIYREFSSYKSNFLEVLRYFYSDWGNKFEDEVITIKAEEYLELMNNEYKKSQRIQGKCERILGAIGKKEKQEYLLRDFSRFFYYYEDDVIY